MLQLYLMSVVLNGISGFWFIFGDVGESDSVEKSMKFSFFGSGFRLVIGILTALVGILKLFLPVKGISSVSGMPIIGDFVPALVGIAGGFILLFGFYREHKTGYDRENDLDRIGDAFIRYRKITGFTLIAIGLLHFLFPGALFL
jgi:ABC-type sulfate transport system permease component